MRDFLPKPAPVEMITQDLLHCWTSFGGILKLENLESTKEHSLGTSQYRTPILQTGSFMNCFALHAPAC